MTVADIKYFHLSPDNKFLDYVIENCELVAAGENIYSVRTDKDEISLVKSKQVSIVKNVNEALSLLRTYTNVKYVYIHFLNDWAIDFVLSLPVSLKVVWIFWGADGYELPSLRKFQYLPKTQHIVNGLQKKPGILQMLKRLLIPPQKKLVKAVKRVNYCATWVEHDFDLIRPYNDKIKFMFFNNNSIEQLLEDQLEFNHAESRQPYIYIGNSGYPTNNHVEAFDLLETGDSYDIVVPLSYGWGSYIRKLNPVGTEIFKDKYRPVMDFMPKDKYHELLLNADMVIMNHTRQQAANNTLAVLWHAKPLFMNKASTLYQTYKNWGLKVFEVNELPLFLKNKKQMEQHLNQNREILKNKLGQQAVSNYYKAFLFKTNAY